MTKIPSHLNGIRGKGKGKNDEKKRKKKGLGQKESKQTLHVLYFGEKHLVEWAKGCRRLLNGGHMVIPCCFFASCCYLGSHQRSAFVLFC